MTGNENTTEIGMYAGNAVKGVYFIQLDTIGMGGWLTFESVTFLGF